MGKLIDLAERFKGIDAKTVEQRVLDIVQAEKQQVVDLNKSQLLNSEDSEGAPLGTYASIAYANKKGKAEVDLKDTGAFYESIFINTEKFPILFGATDKKTGNLVERYGKDIFGLTKSNQAVVSKEIIKTGLIGWIRGLLHV